MIKGVQEDVMLNLNELDLEWERQPTLMEHYTELLSKSNKELAEAKIVLSAKVAEKKLYFRLEGEIKKDNKTTKITEGALYDIIDSDVEIVYEKKKLAQKEYEVDTLKGVVEALRNKKSALEREVELYISGYFSSPKDQRTLLNQKRKQGENINNE